MPMPNTYEACRVDLFTGRSDLEKKYPGVIVEKIVRVRSMYNDLLNEPSSKDRQLVVRQCTRFRCERSAAYADLAIVRQLLPQISSGNRDFHRWRYNEKILDAYNRAKTENDYRTMERVASSYAKFNRIDLEDEQRLPYDLVAVQPFTATDDPTVLGIKPIPNLQEKIDAMIAKYKKETIDIEDVDFEPVDLEEDDLFANGESREEKSIL